MFIKQNYFLILLKFYGMIKQKDLTQTIQFKKVFKNSVNDHNTLFGGEAMKWMDEVAYISAIRFSKEKLVTIATGNIKFIHPIPIGSIVQIVGKLVKAGSVKIEINVEIYQENIFSGELKKSVTGNFFFAAIDENGHPQRLQLFKN